MLNSLKDRITSKIPRVLYDRKEDELTPLGDTLLITVIVLLVSASLSLFLPIAVALFLVYTLFIYLSAKINYNYRLAEKAIKKKNKNAWPDE